MASNEITKVKFSVSGLQMEYEGREAFLQSSIPDLLQSTDKLQTSRLAAPLSILQQSIDASQSTQEAAGAIVDSLKHDLDSLGELSETESLRLQTAMDRLSKLMTTLSNILKKMSDTTQSITQNLK